MTESELLERIDQLEDQVTRLIEDNTEIEGERQELEVKCQEHEENISDLINAFSRIEVITRPWL